MTEIRDSSELLLESEFSKQVHAFGHFQTKGIITMNLLGVSEEVISLSGLHGHYSHLNSIIYT